MYIHICIYMYIHIYLYTHKCLTHDGIVSWIWISVPYVWIMSHFSTIHVTHMNESWRASPWVLTHNSLSPFTNQNLPCHTIHSKRAVWQDSFWFVTGLFCVCEMNYRVVWHNSRVRSCIYVAWLICMCGMTHLYARHDSFTCALWLVHMCTLTQLYAWYKSFMFHDTTHSYMTWLIHMCAIVLSHVWHDAFMCVWHDSFICVTWHDSFICIISYLITSHHIHVCDMTHLYVHITFTCVTWLILKNMCEVIHPWKQEWHHIRSLWHIHMCDMTLLMCEMAQFQMWHGPSTNARTFVCVTRHFSFVTRLILRCDMTHPRKQEWRHIRNLWHIHMCDMTLLMCEMAHSQMWHVTSMSHIHICMYTYIYSHRYIYIYMYIDIFIYIFIYIFSDLTYHRRRRPYLKQSRLSKLQTSSLSGVPVTLKQVFTGNPKISNKFLREWRESPSLARAECCHIIIKGIALRCDMTHPRKQQWRHIRSLWCDMTHSHMWHDSFIFVTLLIHWSRSRVCDTIMPMKSGHFPL